MSLSLSLAFSLSAPSLSHKTKVQDAGARTRVRTFRQAEPAVNVPRPPRLRSAPPASWSGGAAPPSPPPRPRPPRSPPLCRPREASRSGGAPRPHRRAHTCAAVCARADRRSRPSILAYRLDGPVVMKMVASRLGAFILPNHRPGRDRRSCRTRLMNNSTPAAVPTS